jgi:D-3-phosphoglycerate dehydrogenase
LKILIVSPIAPHAIEELQKEHNVVCAFNPTTDTLGLLIRDQEVLIFRSGVSITAELMERAPNLSLLIRAGSGIDNLDLEYVHQRGLKLVRVPEPGAKAVAEMSFAMMLALSRSLMEADRTTRQGQWAKYKLSGYLLTGKILGIIGVGNIGSRVGRMGAAWGMEVIACDMDLSPTRAAKLAKENIRLTDFNEVISTADYVSLHVPLDDTTRYLINADVLSRMKPGAFLINLARGGVVDENALCEALTDGGILRGAALDVHEQEGEGKISPLAELPNVILTPHIGAMTVDSQNEIGHRVVEAINSIAANHPRLA